LADVVHIHDNFNVSKEFPFGRLHIWVITLLRSCLASLRCLATIFRITCLGDYIIMKMLSNYIPIAGNTKRPPGIRMTLEHYK